MKTGSYNWKLTLLGSVLGLTLFSSGCASFERRHHFDHVSKQLNQTRMPRELDKVTHPTYIIEPPDILIIEAINSVRPPTAKLEEGEIIGIRVGGTFPIDPEGDPVTESFKHINGEYMIENDGTVDLGPEYGRVPLKGLTVAEAKVKITEHLKTILAEPQVSVTLPNIQTKQQIAGQFLVMPDGTVNLGIYGRPHLAGLSLDEATMKLEQHISDHFVNPQIRIELGGINSKVYYIITDGAGMGDQIYRLPVYGSETVLDAISEIQGLPQFANTGDIWISRPAPAGSDCAQILPVNWDEISKWASTETNYQIMPGDRIYIRADQWYTVSNTMAKVFAPIEQALGFSILGKSTYQLLKRSTSGGGGGLGGGGLGGGGF